MNSYIMLKRTLNYFCLIGTIMLLFFLPGCEKKDPDLGKEILIRVDDRVMTVIDFNNAFEIAKIAYENEIKEHPEEVKKARIRLLNQLTVEMILLERAEELGIGISDAEFENAVSAIKSDYPEGEFENTLLEFAVSYDSWKDRLKNRLIQEKVIEEELKNRITITPEDISEFYQKNYGGKEKESTQDKNAEDINETIVKQLRRQKAEEAYNSWIEDLKGQYKIEINNDQWEKVTEPKSIEKDGQAVSDVSKSE
ncbi:MAG: hypothetical protein GY850_21330 [bacterium]|nr:hypothetical protein [bacterium]